MILSGLFLFTFHRIRSLVARVRFNGAAKMFVNVALEEMREREHRREPRTQLDKLHRPESITERKVFDCYHRRCLTESNGCSFGWMKIQPSII